MPTGGLPESYILADMAYRRDQLEASFHRGHASQRGVLRRAVTWLRHRVTTAAAKPALRGVGDAAEGTHRPAQRPMRAVGSVHH